jgi:hypothetical protein
MHFQKHDLENDQYHWKGASTDLFNGQPSRRLFDRYNGDQVLFLINFYGSLSERFTIAEGREIENKIRNELPLQAQSEISVFNWIRNVLYASA